MQLKQDIRGCDIKINVITLHGVRSRGEWQKKFDKYIKDSGRTDINHIIFSYGFIPAIFCTLPFLQRFYTNKFRKWLKQQNLTGKTYIVAHSFGSYIGFHGSDEIQVEKLLLFGSVLRCRTDFDNVVPDRIKSVENWHSLEDEVCQLNPLGHAGHFGFRNKNTTSKTWHRKPYKNKKIINHRCFTLEHTGYFPQKFHDVLELLS